ncbi:MAG: spore coat associated protein CotJA [Acutalibacteraceae bacterium]
MSLSLLLAYYIMCQTERNDIMETVKNAMDSYGIKRFPEETPYAMAYVPFQPYYDKTYSVTQGFEAGTMYPNLNKPFYGSKCYGDDIYD